MELLEWAGGGGFVEGRIRLRDRDSLRHLQFGQDLSEAATTKFTLPAANPLETGTNCNDPDSSPGICPFCLRFCRPAAGDVILTALIAAQSDRMDSNMTLTPSFPISAVMWAYLVAGFYGTTAFAQTSHALDVEKTIATVAEDPAPPLFFAGAIPRTKAVLDDATLNDVCSVGQNCWAVGERGVVLLSEDAGQSWETSALSKDCSLTSVCFLTNQIGFVAGAEFNPLSRRRNAVLLMTRDAGQTWTDLRSGGDTQALTAGFTRTTDLPPLSYVRFFDLENAIVVGRGDSIGTHGMVFRSQDGGQSWKALRNSEKIAGTNAIWTVGAFLSAKDGIVIGHGNAIGAVVADRIVTIKRPLNILRQIHAVSLSPDGQGWLAGDGAFLQHSTDGGITWKPVLSAVPPEMTEILDFKAVCHQGNTVCIAGSPGSLVLQSNDSGASWSARRTPDSAPINALTFAGQNVVVAIGPMGKIHRSPDGGATWNAVRNANYRSSILCLTTNPDSVSMRMLAKLSGDEGFRTVVTQPSARMPRQDIDDTLAGDRLSGILPQMGASAFERDWMFSRTHPLQNQVAAELRKTWDLETDGRVGELLPLRLARLLRIWRPDVVCIEPASADDQVAVIWKQALATAMQISAGEDHRSAVLDSVGLSPWTPKRTVVRELERTSSPLTFSGESLLANVGTLTDLIADHGKVQLAGDRFVNPVGKSPPTSTDSYATLNPSIAGAVPHMLAGMMVAPGTDSRRLLTHAAADQLGHMKRLAQKSQQQRAVLANQAQRTDTPLNLIAQLKTIGSGLPDRLAMRQLLSLSQMYERVENLEGQIAVLKEITERFPESPEAADACELLYHYYSSAELRFLRRRSEADSRQDKRNTDRDSHFIQQVGNTIPGIAKQPIMRAGTGQNLHNPQGSDQTAVTALWDANADAAMRQLNRLSPERASSSTLLLRHAANLRLRKNENGSNAILANAANQNGPFALMARAEMQAVFGAASAPVPVINLKKNAVKPYLDATLNDGIWEDATEIPMVTVGQSDAADAGCLIMLGWDDDHIYLSGRVNRVAGRHYDMDKTQTRTHDSRHGIRDRIQFSFDTDRDYTTAFHFTVDEAGQTSERCWKSRHWNPKWFVAADMDEQSWRFEIAIPQEELVEQAVKPGQLWAMQIHRTVPGVLQQTLKTPDNEGKSEAPAEHGLLRFIRNRN